MKIITPIVLAGAALAFCGCTSADGPVFANDSTKAATAGNAGPSTEEQTREVVEQMQGSNSLYTPGSVSNGGDVGKGQQSGMQGINPYGH